MVEHGCEKMIILVNGDGEIFVMILAIFMLRVFYTERPLFGDDENQCDRGAL